VKLLQRVFGVAALFAASASAQPQLAIERLAAGLERPLGIVSAGDSRLFIVGGRGKIYVYDRGILPALFLDLSDLITQPTQLDPESGLLGLAFHPRFDQNGFFFVDYVNKDGDIVIARYSVSPFDPNVGARGSAFTILTIPHPQFSDHFGGQLRFGPDGYLYIAVGDGGGSGDPLNRAQDPSLLLGKILRIDVDTFPYVVPLSNPFVGQGGKRPEIWALGLRNPWRFSFDRLTADLWIADVGENLWEEVNMQPATSHGGENYGWVAMEGSHCFRPSTNCENAAFTMPIFDYSHNDGSCSVTGGYVYRGAQFPRMQGTYFFGDFCTGAIYGMNHSVQKLLDTDLLITTFGEDQHGELYVADIRGSIYRILDTAPPPQPRRRAVH
jgi:glucose/arabinose dehydrogenase